MKIRCYNIRYDTDGLKVKGLPKEIIFDNIDSESNVPYEGADWISDKTGWCVVSFSWEEVKEPALANAGYTLIELLICIFIIFMAVAVIAFLGFGGYAAWHFIAKVW